MNVVGIHPAAEIFPPLEGTALAQLVEDIRTNGLREPITLHPDGRVLDGRNRWRACLVAGIEPQFRKWDGNGSPIAYIVSLNLHRRHLDESQRALVAARIANLSEGRPSKETASIDAVSDDAPVSQTSAAELLNVGRASVQRAKEVIERAEPEVVQAVERGAISVSAAAETTSFEPEVQREIVERVEAGERPSEVIREKKAHVANNSGNNEWYTPPEFIAAARDAMGDIDLDPASSAIANGVVKAHTFYSVEDDGLSKSWRGNVWMNPPYAQPLIQQFADAVSEKFDGKEIKRACVLVNNATETAWFQRILQSAAAVCFLKGRVRFIDQDGNPSGAPLQGQAVLYLGDNLFRFARAFEAFGIVLVKP